MKMSRVALKALIKECLVEILSDGLGGDLVEAVDRRPLRENKRPEYRSMVKPKPAQGASGGSSQDAYSRIPTSALQNAIIESAGGNSIMQDIFADTAMTSLPTLMQGHSATPHYPAGSAEHTLAQSTPEEVFGEHTDRWADLAFNNRSSGNGVFSPPPPAPVLRKLSIAELDAPVDGVKKTA